MTKLEASSHLFHRLNLDVKDNDNKDDHLMLLILQFWIWQVFNLLFMFPYPDFNRNITENGTVFYNLLFIFYKCFFWWWKTIHNIFHWDIHVLEFIFECLWIFIIFTDNRGRKTHALRKNVLGDLEAGGRRLEWQQSQQ